MVPIQIGSGDLTFTMIIKLRIYAPQTHPLTFQCRQENDRSHRDNIKWVSFLIPLLHGLRDLPPQALRKVAAGGAGAELLRN